MQNIVGMIWALNNQSTENTESRANLSNSMWKPWNKKKYKIIVCLEGNSTWLQTVAYS
jgi:hypothetical protein